MNLNKIKLVELTAKDYSDRYLQWMNDPNLTKFTEQKYIKHKNLKWLTSLRDLCRNYLVKRRKHLQNSSI
jgi:hypothetical protein